MISSQDGTEDRLPRAALRPWRAAGSAAVSAGADDGTSAAAGTGAAGAGRPAATAGAAGPESATPEGVRLAAVSSRARAIGASWDSGTFGVSCAGRAWRAGGGAWGGGVWRAGCGAWVGEVGRVG